MKAMVSKPYAKVLKEAFPHATFVGFTGTPIAETYQTFGDEIGPIYNGSGSCRWAYCFH